MGNIIALDYDETYTVNPNMWNEVIAVMRKHGFTVVCCTNRVGNPYADRDVIEDMRDEDVPVVFAAAHKDKWEAMEKAGYIAENLIWIDDRPMYIWNNRSFDELD
jgi:hypothetical protein